MYLVLISFLFFLYFFALFILYFLNDEEVRFAIVLYLELLQSSKGWPCFCLLSCQKKKSFSFTALFIVFLRLDQMCIVWIFLKYIL